MFFVVAALFFVSAFCWALAGNWAFFFSGIAIGSAMVVIGIVLSEDEDEDEDEE